MPRDGNYANCFSDLGKKTWPLKPRDARIILGAMDASDDYEDLWELAEFAVREAYALRSFLEYLKGCPNPAEVKLEVQNWRKRVGLNLGNPRLDVGILQKFRGAPPEIRREAIRLVLAGAHHQYFEGSE